MLQTRLLCRAMRWVRRDHFLMLRRRSVAEQAEGFQTFVHGVDSPVALNADLMRQTEAARVALGAQFGLADFPQGELTQKEFSVPSGRHLYPPLLKQDPRDYLSTSGSLVSRACYAASRTFVARDDSGKTRLNTSYFLAVLSSVAIHSARRPYWARSTSETFSDFGSTIGSDAGINVFHGFEPGIRQIAKRFAPKFVSRIEERISGARP